MDIFQAGGKGPQMQGLRRTRKCSMCASKSFCVDHMKASVKVSGARMFIRCLLAIALKMMATLTMADTVTCRMAPRRNIILVQLGLIARPLVVS